MVFGIQNVMNLPDVIFRMMILMGVGWMEKVLTEHVIFLVIAWYYGLARNKMQSLYLLQKWNM